MSIYFCKFFQHYFQSSKPSISRRRSGRRRLGRFRFRRRRNAGKSLLTFEWTNQHGCGDQDLNCNFVLQYRCQDDTKHKTLNAHSMRNGKIEKNIYGSLFFYMWFPAIRFAARAGCFLQNLCPLAKRIILAKTFLFTKGY